jgi:hypothetical protein
LDQRYLACAPPQLLLDDPTYLPLTQLNHKPSTVGSEIVSGNEGRTQTGESLKSPRFHREGYKGVLAEYGQQTKRTIWEPLGTITREGGSRVARNAS